MRVRFNPDQGHIIVPITIHALSGIHRMNLTLDTGSTHTVLSRASLLYYGLTPESEARVYQVVTGSGRTSAPTILVPEIRVGEISRQDFQVFAMDFPEGSGIEGVLGLDFLRGLKLTLDFKQGLLEIE